MGASLRLIEVIAHVNWPSELFFGLIALLDPYLSKSCGYRPQTNLNTKQPPMFWTPSPLLTRSTLTWHPK